MAQDHRGVANPGSGAAHRHLCMQEDGWREDGRSAGDSTTAHDAHHSQYANGHRGQPELPPQGKAWGAATLQQQASGSGWDSPGSQQPQVGRSAWDDVPQAQTSTSSYQDHSRGRLTANGGGRQAPSYDASQGYDQQGYYEERGPGSNSGSVSGSGYGQHTGGLSCIDQGTKCKV